MTKNNERRKECNFFVCEYCCSEMVSSILHAANSLYPFVAVRPHLGGNAGALLEHHPWTFRHEYTSFTNVFIPHVFRNRALCFGHRTGMRPGLSSSVQEFHESGRHVDKLQMRKGMEVV